MANTWIAPAARYPGGVVGLLYVRPSCFILLRNCTPILVHTISLRKIYSGLDELNGGLRSHPAHRLYVVAVVTAEREVLCPPAYGDSELHLHTRLEDLLKLAAFLLWYEDVAISLV